MTSAARTIIVTIVLSAGAGFIAGYLLGRGPGWVLWESRGTGVHATTEFFFTRSGCVKTRDAWNIREETSRQDAWTKWRQENPNPGGMAAIIGPGVFYVGYDCFPVGVNPGQQRFPVSH